MKVAFVEPYAGRKKVPERFAGCSYELYHMPDLANLYLAGKLLRGNHSVRYIDGQLEGRDEKHFFGLVLDAETDVFIIHSVFLSKDLDIRFSRKLLEDAPAARVFFHGPEPTRVPEEYLFSERTMVFRGEPEDSVPAFIAGRKTGGVSRISGGRVMHEPPAEEVDLESLPFPPWDREFFRRYAARFRNPKFSSFPYATLLASRGCSHRCLFCVPNSVSFARELEWRKHSGRKPPAKIASAGKVISEFESLQAAGFKSLMAMDDQFLWSRERTLRICEGIAHLGLEWGCLSRADSLTDPEVVSSLRRAGCRVVDIGVESLSRENLEFVNKKLDAGTVKLAIRTLKDSGIDPKLNIMLGCNPAQSARQLKDEVNEVLKLDVDSIMFSIATPFEGTDFHDLCSKKGYLCGDVKSVDPLRRCIVSYPEAGPGEIEAIQRSAYRRFYLKPARLLRLLAKGDFGRLAVLARAALKVIR